MHAPIKGHQRANSLLFLLFLQSPCTEHVKREKTKKRGRLTNICPFSFTYWHSIPLLSSNNNNNVNNTIVQDRITVCVSCVSPRSLVLCVFWVICLCVVYLCLCVLCVSACVCCVSLPVCSVCLCLCVKVVSVEPIFSSTFSNSHFSTTAW